MKSWIWGSVCLALLGCSTLHDPKDQILARVNGEPIREGDLIATLDKEDQKTYLAFKKQKIDQLVAKKLFEQEAKKRNISIQDLLTVEIFSKSNVTDEEIRKFYESNKKNYKGKKHEVWKREIAEFLEKEKQKYWAKQLISAISKRSDVEYHLSQ